MFSNTIYIILPWFCKTNSIKIRNIKPLKVRRPSTRSKTIFCGVPGICFSGKEDHRGPPNQNDHVHFWRSSLHRSNQFQSNDRQCSTALCIPNEILFKINSSHGVLSRHFRWNKVKATIICEYKTVKIYTMIPPGKYVCLLLVVSAFWAMATHRKHDDQTEHHFPFMCMFELDFIFCAIPTSKSNGFASNLTGHGTFFVTSKLNNCNSHARFTSTTIHTVAIPNGVYNFTSKIERFAMHKQLDNVPILPKIANHTCHFVNTNIHRYQFRYSYSQL